MSEDLVIRLRWQAEACLNNGSPLYAHLCACLADDVEARGPSAGLLRPAAGHAFPSLGLLAAVHRLALKGEAPDVARHYPSTGGDGDHTRAWQAVRAVLADRADALHGAALETPQTNEVGRSASLVGGFLTVAAEHHKPLRVLEVGASAGLNLRFDGYRYEQRRSGCGPVESPLVMRDLWPDAIPPFDAPLEVIDRRGCDLRPIDPTSDDGQLTLLGAVWPDQLDRIARLRTALEVAARFPVDIDRADVAEWLVARLAAPTPGVATVVFHSLVWPFLPDETRDAFMTTLARAGSIASTKSPFAWLRLEPVMESAPDQLGELRLTTWPAGDERLLARCTFHYGPVRWL